MTGEDSAPSGAEATTRCAQCGAVAAPEQQCEACFHALLAYENERPAAFAAVHHLTVPTYYLQHPAGYTTEVLHLWHAMLAEILDGRATPPELLQRARRQFDGAKRVRDPGAAAPAWWPRVWPVTVQSVLKPEETPAVGEYVARAKAWAAATRRALDEIVRR